MSQVATTTLMVHFQLLDAFTLVPVTVVFSHPSSPLVPMPYSHTQTATGYPN